MTKGEQLRTMMDDYYKSNEQLTFNNFDKLVINLNKLMESKAKDGLDHVTIKREELMLVLLGKNLELNSKAFENVSNKLKEHFKNEDIMIRFHSSYLKISWGDLH